MKKKTQQDKDFTYGVDRSLCSFEYLSNPPGEIPKKFQNKDGTINVYSVSIFRPKEKRNDKAEIYLSGLHTIAKVLEEHKGKLPVMQRVYIDKSFLSPQFPEEVELYNKYIHKGDPSKGLKPLTSYPNTQIIEFDCPKYKVDRFHHRGFFSSFVRFHAGYDPNVKYALYRDTDFVENSIREDLKVVDDWMKTGKKYHVYFSNIYVAPHSEDRQSLFAGAWGSKGNLPEQLWVDMFDLLHSGYYNYQKVINKYKTKLQKLVDTLIEDINELNSIEEALDEFEFSDDYKYRIAYDDMYDELPEVEAQKKPDYGEPKKYDGKILRYDEDEEVLYILRGKKEKPIDTGDIHEIIEYSRETGEEEVVYRDDPIVENLEAIAQAECVKPVVEQNILEYYDDDLDKDDMIEVLTMYIHVLNCVNRDGYKISEIADLFEIQQELQDALYNYGIDEIIMNHVVKKHIFKIPDKFDPIDVPLSLFYCLTKDITEPKECLDLLRATQLGLSAPDTIYDWRRVQEYWNYYTEKDRGLSVDMTQLITPFDFLQKLEHFTGREAEPLIEFIGSLNHVDKIAKPPYGREYVRVLKGAPAMGADIDAMSKEIKKLKEKEQTKRTQMMIQKLTRQIKIAQLKKKVFDKILVSIIETLFQINDKKSLETIFKTLYTKRSNKKVTEETATRNFKEMLDKVDFSLLQEGIRYLLKFYDIKNMQEFKKYDITNILL